MTPEEEKQAEEAKGFIRAHKAFLKQKFAAISTHAKSKHPVSIFMAGSPGAGKTEFSKRLVELVIGEDGSLPVRIDADEIREIIPGYNGSNSNIFQGASARGVEILYAGRRVRDRKLPAVPRR